MDPVRSDHVASEALTGAERDARIEQLLLTGLDHYFAHDYDQAINLWTRVLFLDRHHDRARAYIERARSAQAEQQRESEALVHQGLDAFHAGDLEGARQLLEEALERGASRDLALGVLDRIKRLGTRESAPRAPRAQRSWTAREPRAPLPSSPSRSLRPVGWAGATLLVLAAVGAAAVGAWGIALPDPGSWTLLTGGVWQGPPLAVPQRAEPLPLPAATEAFLSRARAFFASGRLRDALRELDRVPFGNALRPDADRLRAEIQRALLAAADSAPAAPAAPATTPTPPADPPDE